MIEARKWVAVGVGGLGHIGVQCLKAMTPAQVIAVDTSEDALKLALAAQGQIKLRSSAYPLEAAGDAIEDLRQGRIHGRAILTPG